VHWKLDPANDPLTDELLVDEGLDLSACTQQAACSAVCPIADSFDYLPHQVVRQVQINERKRVLRSSAIWLCSDCGACTAACPQQVDVARMMAELRRRSYRLRVEPAADVEGVRASHEALLEELEGHGRPADARVALSYKMRSMDVFTDWTVGAALFSRGRLALSAEEGGREGPAMVDLARSREIERMHGHEDLVDWAREREKKEKSEKKEKDVQDEKKPEPVELPDRGGEVK
jgi:heterodisulfide reductase subunit C